MIFGTEGPKPAQHRCRVCVRRTETYRPTGSRMLRAKRHADADGECRGSFGAVDPWVR